MPPSQQYSWKSILSTLTISWLTWPPSQRATSDSKGCAGQHTMQHTVEKRPGQSVYCGAMWINTYTRYGLPTKRKALHVQTALAASTLWKHALTPPSLSSGNCFPHKSRHTAVGTYLKHVRCQQSDKRQSRAVSTMLPEAHAVPLTPASLPIRANRAASRICVSTPSKETPAKSQQLLAAPEVRKAITKQLLTHASQCQDCPSIQSDNLPVVITKV